MTMEVINSNDGEGGVLHSNGVRLRKILTELQGLRIKVAAGAAAGTKMNVADLRTSDTLVAVISSNAGVLADDTANCTVQPTQASGTITCAGVTANDTVTVHGNTYTFVAAAADVVVGGPYVVIGGSNNATAANLAAAINAYETRPVSGQNGLATKAAVVATVSTNVVTVTSVADGTAGNAYTLTSSNGTRLAVTGAGTLTGGTATGGIKSTTNNTGFSMVVVYFDKDNLVGA